MVNSHRGILPPELVLAVMFQEGGQGAFYVDGSSLTPCFYRQVDSPWAQPHNTCSPNNLYDGVMQVSPASRASGLVGPYPNTESGYDIAIADGCAYLLVQYQNHQTFWESVLHYNTGGGTLFIYKNGEGDPLYLQHVAYTLRNLVPALYGLNNGQLANQLDSAQAIVNSYLNNNAILPNQGLSYYASYQSQLDAALHSPGAVPTTIIALNGSLSFGSVAVGNSQTLLMTIANNGNTTLNVGSITYPSGFNGNWASGSILAGASINITVTFTPGNSADYGGAIAVNSDATSGTSNISVSGTGVSTQPITYSVTPSAGGNGTIDPSSTQSVNSSGAVSFAATPATGYVVSQWLLNNVVAQVSGPVFTVTNVTAAASVQVVFKSLLPPPNQLTGVSFGNSLFSFILNGQVGSNYVILVSADLIRWTPFSTNTIPPGGSVIITDPAPGNQPARFYRAVPANGPAGQNLVVNGDFEAGDIGFTSEYELDAQLASGGQYRMGTTSRDYPGDAVGGDHTTGHGLMMVVNGATSRIAVWEQTVQVAPNTSYTLSAWAASWGIQETSPAQLQFQINGSPVGVLIMPSTVAADSLWQSFSAAWNSGANSSATIRIVDLIVESDGNDFCLDDISLVTSP